jgi:S1-C subfamily serine protease
MKQDSNEPTLASGRMDALRFSRHVEGGIVTTGRTIKCVVLIACVIAATVGAAWVGPRATVKLKSGEELAGELRKLQSGSYSLILDDGSSKFLRPADIESIDGQPLDAVGPGEAGTSPAFKQLKLKVEKYDFAVRGVADWERFIATKPAEPDLTSAKAELAIWNERYQSGSERVAGQWLDGAAVAKLREEVDRIVESAMELESTQPVRALGLYADARRRYPTHYLANFRSGYLLAQQGNPDSVDLAIARMQTAAEINPDAPEIWANLAVLYTQRRRHEQAIAAAERAVTLFNSPPLTSLLTDTIQAAPRNIYQANPRVRAMIDRARMIVASIGPTTPAGAMRTTWTYFGPGHFDDERKQAGIEIASVDQARVPGVVWTGSGFFISPDGFFLTNRHVLTGEVTESLRDDLSFRIRLDDGSEALADVVALDDKSDLALLRVALDREVPFLALADDNPPMADRALVLGFPRTGTRNLSLQISEGVIKSVNPGDPHEVWLDLNTTHGNSGGPILDRDGRVVAVLTAGRTQDNMTIILGVGPSQMRDFLRRLGPMAPAVTYEPAAENRREFDGVELTKRARGATLLVYAIGEDEK